MLASLKTSPLQSGQGRLFGMSQSTANPWIHVLWVIRQATLRALGDAPSRAVPALAQRIGVTEADAATLVVPAEEPSPPAEPPVAGPSPVSASPRLATMGRNGASSAPRTRLRRRAVRGARQHAIP
jgi:hypothetical protein